MQAIWAVVLLAGAMLALAPSSASAHAGHSHSAVAAQQAHATKAPVGVLQSTAMAAKPVTATQSLSAAVLPAAPSGDHPECDGPGCCASGHCTGCHGFVLTSVVFTAPSPFSTLVVLPDAPPHGGADVGRLRRPPKSFA
jgi:hypothetical protein